jgi:FtsP/CotA-like multicopper oxidase with cupredoxin domain
MNQENEQIPTVHAAGKPERSEQNEGGTRRHFLGKSLAAGAALALGATMPNTEADAQSAVVCGPVKKGENLIKIAEITKPAAGSPVKGTIKVINENKTYLLTGTQCQSGQMRFLTKSNPDGSQAWPPPSMKGLPSPGPTIRAHVGDRVEITLMNQVNVDAFNASYDAQNPGGAEKLDLSACDQVTQVNPSGSTSIYPGNPAFDEMPNCFHGSSTANLHYHGTHVSPNVLEDNVFVQLRPSPFVNGKPTVNEKFLVDNDFPKIFGDCQTGHSPHIWNDLPKKWRDQQQQMLVAYDTTLPDQADKLWPKNEYSIHDNAWPQYFIGAYPSCFRLPVWNGQPTSMGQSPGTHWYHAHKHGSTALNLANGMAGAFIISGPYDDAIRKLYNATEQVMVFQQFDAVTNLERARGTTKGPEQIYVNGQYQPVIEMKAGETQFWRMVNACHTSTVAPWSVATSSGTSPSGLRWVQTAQDGVQLDPRNYQLGVKIAQPGGPGTAWTNPALTTPMTAPPWFGNLAPGNRVDLLVQADPKATVGTVYTVTAAGQQILTVKVVAGTVPVLTFPAPQSQFPAMPGFLTDIDASKVSQERTLTFNSGGFNNRPSPPPAQTINDKKFEDHFAEQCMVLGATERWRLNNTGGPAHPFHIHINPFQIVAINATQDETQEIKLPQPWIWWDVIAIPRGGYVKFLSRFVDFTGAYVLHCHILAHEDRGMMQMVETAYACPLPTHLPTKISHH